jgi:hypothetical protein
MCLGHASEVSIILANPSRCATPLALGPDSSPAAHAKHVHRNPSRLAKAPKLEQRGKMKTAAQERLLPRWFDTALDRHLYQPSSRTLLEIDLDLLFIFNLKTFFAQHSMHN